MDKVSLERYFSSTSMLFSRVQYKHFTQQGRQWSRTGLGALRTSVPIEPISVYFLIDDLPNSSWPISFTVTITSVSFIFGPTNANNVSIETVNGIFSYSGTQLVNVFITR